MTEKECIFCHIKLGVFQKCPKCGYPNNIERTYIKNENMEEFATEIKVNQMSRFVKMFEEKNNLTKTENGAITNKSTKNAVLDLFSMGGALRSRSENDIVNMFIKAYREDKLLALKCLFYLRDIRGGQGERKTFRTCLKWLAVENPAWLSKNLNLIPEYGRWDDLFELINTPLEPSLIAFIGKQLIEDKNSESPSLCAKWMPSENTTSKKTVRLASYIRQKLRYSSVQYRKILSSIRKKLNIVEQKMCKNQWEAITYKAVPSRSMLKYSRKMTKKKQPGAFLRHDGYRFNSYLNDVKSGKTKINAATLFPADIAHAYVSDPFYGRLTHLDETLEAQWKALPNYKSIEENIICLIDISGSMRNTLGKESTQPIDAALSLGIYIAEHNTGIFNNTVMTFSESPKMLTFSKSANLFTKINEVYASGEGLNTNLLRAFMKILEFAIEYKLQQSEMPTKIIILSDMEFDPAGIRYNLNNLELRIDTNKTTFDYIEEAYRNSGYKRPQLIFWNVSSRQNNVPVKKDEFGTALVSGYSPSVIDAILNNKELVILTPYDVMLNKLNSERYSLIK